MRQKETIVELIQRLANEGYAFEQMTIDQSKEAEFLFMRKQETKLFRDEITIAVSLYAAGNVRNLIRQYFGN